MQSYAKYKDSGVKWLKEIPNNWEVKRLKYLVSKAGSGVTPKGGASVYEKSGIPLLRSQNVHFDGLRLDDVAYISEETHDAMSGSKVKIGDVLLNITGGSIGRCFYIGKGLGEFNVNQHVCIIRPNDHIETKYLYWLMRAETVGQEQINIEQTGSGREGLNFEALKNFTIPYIEKTEQTAIANYLDQKTAEINKLIKQKQQLITLYQEKKAALINQVVIKGLNPNAKMKDSGIEWLGDIPVSWKIKRLRYAGNCKNGVSAGAEFFGSGHPFVNYTDVYKNTILPSEVSGLALSTESDRVQYSIEDGDILFTRTSETVEEIGLASTCLSAIKDAIFAGFLIRFRPYSGLFNPEFSKYYFSCSLHRRFFVKEMNLVTRASLSQELLKRMPVLIPSDLEQSEIARFLDKKTAELDEKIAKTKHIIELQKEYRTALISEAVTGKFKVPELVAKELN